MKIHPNLGIEQRVAPAFDTALLRRAFPSNTLAGTTVLRRRTALGRSRRSKGKIAPRPATRSQNCRNREAGKNRASRYRGVQQISVVTWRAYIKTAEKSMLHLGTYATEEDAAIAVNRGLREHLPAEDLPFVRFNPVTDDGRVLKRGAYGDFRRGREIGRGVSYHRRERRWRAYRRIAGRYHHLGYFATEAEALAAVAAARAAANGSAS